MANARAELPPLARCRSWPPAAAAAAAAAAAVDDYAAAAAAAAAIGGHYKSAGPISIKMLSRASNIRTLNRILCV